LVIALQSGEARKKSFDFHHLAISPQALRHFYASTFLSQIPKPPRQEPDGFAHHFGVLSLIWKALRNCKIPFLPVKLNHRGFHKGAFMFKTSALSAAATAVLLAAATLPSQAQSPRISVYRASPAAQTADLPANADAIAKSRLPLIDPSVFPLGGFAPGAAPGGVAGARGGLALDENGADANGGVAPQANGSATEQWPYTTARVAVTALGKDKSLAGVPVSSSPYRQTGKLYMQFGASLFVCTASLIAPSVLITAAHCVHNYGQGQPGFASAVWWYPANTNGGSKQPYGRFNATTWAVPTFYFNGTDTCLSGAVGVVCNNDLAIVILAPVKNKKAGTTLGGFYGYGVNGYSFITSPAFGNTVVGDISQLGYPVAFDQGYQMQRNNSFGKYVQGTGTNAQVLKNTQLGSALTGGSSGGPWLVNFGTRPTITGSASLGSNSTSNVVVGVTSWGYTTVGVNVQGASFFGQNFEFPLADYGGYGGGNIGFMVQAACTLSPAACTP
jgi:hypothetical protein